MAGVFQPNVFQNNVFQIDPSASTAGQTILTRGPSGANFSRKRFDELKAAWRAQEALERKAEDAKGKRRKALKAAAEAAAESLHAIEAKRGEVEAATLEAEALSLKNMIDAALSGQTMAATINRALEVVRVASEQAEIEDEEEAIMLLLQ